MPTRTLAVLFVLAACNNAPESSTASSKAALNDTCTQFFQKQRACTDTFIPALVDLRQSLDKPSGIANAPRAEVIEAALEEWKSDSTDEAIATQCGRMASELPQIETKRCNAIDACGEFVPCVMPLMKAHLAR